jgi:hypothetical protein
VELLYAHLNLPGGGEEVAVQTWKLVGFGLAALQLVAELNAAVTPKILFGGAQAAEAAIRAPIECRDRNRTSAADLNSFLNWPISCGTDFTMGEAKKSYSEWQASIRALPKLFPNVHVPPSELRLTPILEDNICYVRSGDPYIWAMVKELDQGQAALDQLLNLAKSGAVFSSKDGYSQHEIVETTSSTRIERHLALCYVSKHLGPPRDCVTVAIITSQEIWLRGKTAGLAPFGCNSAAESRPSGSIRITYNVRSEASPMLFAEALQKILISAQSLSTELVPSSDPEGTVYSVLLNSSAPLRDSKVLSKGWRESFDFDVYFGRRDSQKAVVSVDGTLQPLVSRLARGSLAEYQGLNDAQRNTYMTTFDNLVGESIKTTCPNFVQIDSETISCK